MSSPQSRLSRLLSEFLPASPPSSFQHRNNHHSLSPALFLPRAAAIEPDALAVYHENARGQTVRRKYAELAERACGLAYFLKKHRYTRVGILCPNTPTFLEAIFGISGASAVNVAVNYRLKADDIQYIFSHSDVDAIIVDAEYSYLLDQFLREKPNVPIIVDSDTDGQSGQYDQAIQEGLQHDRQHGSRSWQDLETEVQDEAGLIALAYTSGTTAKPKGVEYTHRSAYLAALGNVIESGLNPPKGQARYLWTLPMFHAMGWTFPWAVTAVRGTHYCLRKIDYQQIWRLLKTEAITHFNAAPTVNTLLCNAPEAEKLPQAVRVTVAASPPTGHLFEQMTNLNLHPVHVYGLTETYGPITKGYQMPSWEAQPTNEKYAKMARQGHGFITSLPVRVVRTDVAEGEIVDVRKDGQDVGEIIFSGNICAKGYYKDPQATRKLFAGGVLHSGDLAVWHEDGAVQIIDRGKDIIISGGENISSIAVESIIVKHSDILEAAIVAVKDEKWGERPKAYVTVKSGKCVSGDGLLQWAKTNPQISGFMMPREVEVVDELPKTSTGKVRKNVLREWAKGDQGR